MLLALLWGLPGLAGDLYVVGGNIFTGLSDTLDPNEGLLIRNGRIVTLGPATDIDDIQRLQLGDDDTIISGLVDLHAHDKIYVDGNRRDETVANPVIDLANGVTTTFTAGELQLQVVVPGDRVR